MENMEEARGEAVAKEQHTSVSALSRAPHPVFQKKFLRYQFDINVELLDLVGEAERLGTGDAAKAALVGIRSQLMERNEDLIIADRHEGYLQYAAQRREMSTWGGLTRNDIYDSFISE